MDWKRKLSSRKMWAAIIGVILSIMVMFGASDDDKNKVTGLITACSTLVIYILSEGSVDSAGAKETKEKAEITEDETEE